MAVVDSLINVLKNLGGVAHLSDIYKEYEKVAGNLIEATIRRTLQQNSSDTKSYNGKVDCFFSEGIGTGIWGLRDFEMHPEPEGQPGIKVSEPLLKYGNHNPSKKQYIVNRIVRDTALVLSLKGLVGSQCQLCSKVIKLPNGKLYSEGHHIKPLGSKHAGPDIYTNLIILCPNCHVDCDYGIICLSLDKIINNVQNVNQEFIDYHNELIYKKVT
jgi:hypothetical protein